MMTLLPVLSWIVFFALACFAGAAFLLYLVRPPLEMSAWLAAVLLALFGLLVVACFSFRGWDLAWSGVGLYCFFLLGYLLANHVFLNRRKPPALPELVRAAQDAGDGRLALVVFTHGEPPLYDPAPWLEAFHEFDQDNVPFIPEPFRPFFLYKLRREYLAIGASSHNKIHARTFEKLKKALQADLPPANLPPAKLPPDTLYYLSFLDTDPRPQAALLQALNDGASAVLLAAFFLTKSSHTLAGWEAAQSALPPGSPVNLAMTAPLWDSQPLIELFIQRAEKTITGSDRSRVGIVLVGYGQPVEWDKKFPTQTEQENRFRQAVARRFIDAGYRRSNILLAWMEFKEPKTAAALETLAAKGLEKILVFPASISAASLLNEVLIPRQAAQAKLPPGVQVIHMGAWDDDDLVIEALRQKILEAYAQMSTVQSEQEEQP